MEIGDISLIHVGEKEALLKSGAASKAEDPEKLKEVSEQFEAILIRQYLSEAMKPMFEGSMMGNDSGAHMYQYMITDAMATELSNNSTFGVASMLQMQLTAPDNTNLKDTLNPKTNDE